MRYIILMFLTSSLFSYVITNKNKDFLPVVYLSFSNVIEAEDSAIVREIYIPSLISRLKKVNANFVFEKKELSDLLIKINYKVKKEKIDIFIDFYDKKENLIFQKSILTYTDRKIFDGVDGSLKIINDFIKQVEIVSPKIDEKLIGRLYFHNFKVGKENYFLYVNDNLVSKYVNKNFDKYITLEANRKYFVRLVKDNNDKTVFEKEFFLQPDTTIEIEYEGKGSIMVEKIKNPEMWRSYKYFFNNKEVETEKEIDNIKAGEHYDFIVKDNFDRIVYKDFIYLEDGELKIIRPELVWTDSIKIKFFSSVNEYWAIGLDYSFMRYFWGGVNYGFNSFYYNGKTIDIKFLTAELGYYFFTDRIYNFKSGIGLSGQYFFADFAPKELGEVMKNGFSLFLNFELFNFFIKPAVFYDFSKVYLQISSGLYIKFDL